METRRIRESVERLKAGRGATSPARAALGDVLCVRVEGPNDPVVVTDISEAVGGAASGAPPGWLLRAALASCDATAVAKRAAREGIELDMLEVVVGSDSDS